MGEPSGYRLLAAEIPSAQVQADGRRGYYRPERQGGIDGIVVRVLDAGPGDTADRRSDDYVTGHEPSSVHAVVDGTGVVELLPDDHVALAAGPSDDTSLVIDVMWPRDDPATTEDVLGTAAEWCATRIRPHAIAIRRCSREQWEAGRSGLIGADELGAGGSSRDFPWDDFLDEIRSAVPRRRVVAAWWRRGRSSNAAVMAAAAAVLVVAGVAGLVIVGGGGGGDGDDAGSTVPSATDRVATTVEVSTTGPVTTGATTVAPTTEPAVVVTDPPPVTTVAPTTTTAPTTTIAAVPSTTVVATVAAVNLSGFWDLEVDVTEAAPTCVEEVDEPPYTSTVFLLHDGGDDVSVVGLGDGDSAWQGTFDGTELIFGGSRGEDGGTTSALFVLRFDRSADDLAGEEFWTWSQGALSCPDGRSTVTGVRVEIEAEPDGEAGVDGDGG